MDRHETEASRYTTSFWIRYSHFLHLPLPEESPQIHTMPTLASQCADTIKSGWDSWPLCQRLCFAYQTMADTADSETDLLLELQLSFNHFLNRRELDMFLYWVLWIKEHQGQYNIARALWFTGDTSRAERRCQRLTK